MQKLISVGVGTVFKNYLAGGKAIWHLRVVSIEAMFSHLNFCQNGAIRLAPTKVKADLEKESIGCHYLFLHYSFLS